MHAILRPSYGASVVSYFGENYYEISRWTVPRLLTSWLLALNNHGIDDVNENSFVFVDYESQKPTSV